MIYSNSHINDSISHTFISENRVFSQVGFMLIGDWIVSNSNIVYPTDAGLSSNPVSAPAYVYAQRPSTRPTATE